MKDPALLELAAQQGRILITHDRRTMTRHVRERLAAGKSNPGLFIVPQRSAIGEIVEWLLLVRSSAAVASRPPFPASQPLSQAGFAKIWQNGGLGTTRRLAETPRR
jgi:hypothetical protein